MPKKCYTDLRVEVSETLCLGLAHGHSLRTMATVLRRGPSTVSRESARNAPRGQPIVLHGARLGAARARQPRRSRTLVAPWLRRYVRTHLSAETIYVVLHVLPLVLLAQLEGTDARSAGHGFTKKLRYLPAPLRNTLTDDRGKEMAEHERLAQRLASQVFFAYPHSH